MTILRSMRWPLVLLVLAGCGGSSNAGTIADAREAGSPVVGTSGGAPSTADRALCTKNTLTVQLANGEKLAGDSKSRGFTSGGAALLHFRASSQDGTYVRLHGSGSLKTGGTLNGPALFERVSGGTRQLYCGSPDSAVTCDDDANDVYRFSVRGASPLESCASATPVAGSIHLCTGGTDCADRAMTGTVAGVDLSTKTSGYVGGADTLVVHTETVGIVIVEMQDTADRAALVYLQDRSNNDVFCAAKKQVTVVKNSYDIELTDFRRMGGCPRGGTTTFEGCAD